MGVFLAGGQSAGQGHVGSSTQGPRHEEWGSGGDFCLEKNWGWQAGKLARNEREDKDQGAKIGLDPGKQECLRSERDQKEGKHDVKGRRWRCLHFLYPRTKGITETAARWAFWL